MKLTNIKAVIYSRFSPRPDAKESESNEKQIERALEYAQEKGYEVNPKHIFQDVALSGMDDERDPDPRKAVEKRPGLCAAIEATRKGMILIVRWRDRISRESYILQYVERVIGAGGGEIEAADEDNDPGVNGRIVRGIKAELARDYVERIRLLTKKAMLKYQAEGRRMGHKDKVPFGWRLDPKDDKRIIRDEDEQAAIELIIELRRNGKGYFAICAALDEGGIPRRGKTWRNAHGTILAILKRNMPNRANA